MDKDLLEQTAAYFIDLEERYGAHNYHPIDVVIQEARGVWVTDVEGKRYLDCLSAYSAVNQGHAHPKILQAMIEQASRVTLTARAFRNDQLGLFYKALCDVTGYERVLPMNSGAEAVETAIKLARKWGYKVKGVADGQQQIIVCDGNFHGRTTTIISFSSEPQYKEGFGPLTPGFVSVPYGDAAALEAAITPNTVAFLVEPIQGENGVIVPPEGYLRRVAEICKRHNVLFINDEIQTGLGRSGKMFVQDYENVRGDIMILGKALSGGFYPVSAILADDPIMSVFQPGDHGSTFGGNPLAAAIARAAIAVLMEENLIENAALMGEYFREQLEEINSPYIKEVRGRGLLIGVELKPEAGGARRFVEALRDNGVLSKETHVHTVRFAPPLVIQRAEIDWALERIRPVLLGQF
ncbi:MAG: ornithine--oxo-acid transaminase [Chloroflexi bacterium CFX4]|nr:ornithine--oxo-acid transaminase [Chloroflexi bacterium CFX4]MDL1921191.1 ornithine--oxo-acid transaminase [Chloroflexi bacterium CFX3]